MKIAPVNNTQINIHKPKNDIAFKAIGITFSHDVQNVFGKKFNSTPQEIGSAMSSLLNTLGTKRNTQNLNFFINLGKKPNILMQGMTMPFEFKGTLVETCNYMAQLVGKLSDDIAKHAGFVDKTLTKQKLPINPKKVDPLNMFKFFNN
jgi:hypothetical protein